MKVTHGEYTVVNELPCEGKINRSTELIHVLNPESIKMVNMPRNGIFLQTGSRV